MASVVNHTAVTDLLLDNLASISLVTYGSCLITSGQTKACDVQICTKLSCQIAVMGCGQEQTMNHIVNTFPLTKSEGGLQLLHKAEEDSQVDGIHSDYSSGKMK